MEWLKHLNQAIDYIESNLTGEISYDKAAEISCCSSYYFQRMFSYVTGFSLSEYIRHRKMTQAAFELQTTDMKVIDIGVKYGYSTPSSFNRAFQNVHGISPSEARKKEILLKSFPPINFSIKITGKESLKYKIVEKEKLKIIGLKTSLCNDIDQNQKIVPLFWEKILKEPSFDKICNFSDENPKKIYGVTDYKNPENINYYIGVLSNKNYSEKFEELEIPATTWVVFEENGDFKESVQNIFKRFITEWLPFSGYEYGNFPDVEVYPIDYQNSKKGNIEVWISIKKRSENKNDI